MLIVCPHCGTSYRVTAESLGENGRSVRCVSCMSVWFEAPHRMEQAAAAETSLSEYAPIRPPLDDVVDMGRETSTPYPAPPDDDESHRAVDYEPGPLARRSSRMSARDLPQTEAPSISPVAGSGEASHAGEEAEKLAAIRARRRRVRRRQAFSGPGLPALICALLLLIGCLIAARQQIVRFLPQTAAIYAAIGLPVNVRGLIFDNIKTTREVQDGVPVLVIEGEIVGTTARIAEVPRLRLAVVNAAGKEIYAWTARAGRSLLSPGEVLQFRSRLASPPEDATGVSVRFFTRRDALAGMM